MKTIAQNLKKGELKLRIESLDDLWCLSQIIEPGDRVRGKTVRKLKLGDAEQRKSESVKKSVFLEIMVTTVEFHDYASALRASGTVTEGPEDISHGSHHTFALEPGSIITIIKDSWPGYMLDKLREASREPKKTMLCILDRDSAVFGLLKQSGFEALLELSGDVERKAEPAAKAGDFYGEVIKKLSDYLERYQLEHIIVASPAFWKEDLFKAVKDDALRKRITLATCSCAGTAAVPEVLARPELAKLLSEQQLAREQQLIDMLLTQIAKNDKVVYGFAESEQAAAAGAVATLLVTDGLIKEKRRTGDFARLDRLMKTVESMRGTVAILTSANGPGRKLDGLGGIAALLRYQLS